MKGNHVVARVKLAGGAMSGEAIVPQEVQMFLGDAEKIEIARLTKAGGTTASE